MTWFGRQLTNYSKSGTAVAYTYDADGLRGKKMVNGTLSTYQYVNGHLAYEKRGNVQYFYFYDSFGKLSSIRFYDPSVSNGSAQNYFTLTNQQGDIVAIYNTAGAKVASYEYDAWGNIISTTDTSNVNISTRNPFRYRGYYYDQETGLYYLQSRYYDPEIGRFISADSQLNNTSVLGFNPFAYCENNPVNFQDATGALPQWIKNTAKWVAKNLVKPVVKTVQKLLSKIDLTYSVGANVSGTPSIWVFNLQIGLSIDTKGNVAYQVSGGGGITGGDPGISITRYNSITNAPAIDRLNGEYYQMGGTVGVPVDGVPIAAGGDLMIIPDLARNKGYFGITRNVGVGTPGKEFHVEWGQTRTLPYTQFNVFEVAQSIYRGIMEW